MIEIKPPHAFDDHTYRPSVFLAGSIEMGTAVDWQAEVTRQFAESGKDILVLNPRRDNWDSSWDQAIDNPVFRQQVDWELNALHAAHYIIFYFAPGTKSPITLLELGLHAGLRPAKLIVCCPEGFWRKGNVDIVCAHYGIRQVATIDDIVPTALPLLFAFERKSA